MSYPTPPVFGLFDTETLVMEGGSARYRFMGKADHCNPYGVVQGGLLSAMLDICLGAAVLSLDPRPASSLEMKTNFLRPVLPGVPIIGEATVVQSGRRTAVVEGELRLEDGKRVARALSTMLFV